MLEARGVASVATLDARGQEKTGVKGAVCAVLSSLAGRLWRTAATAGRTSHAAYYQVNGERKQYCACAPRFVSVSGV